MEGLLEFREENGEVSIRGERREGRNFFYHSPHTFSIMRAYVAFKRFFEFRI